MEILRKWGLQTWASFTIGHDTDTVESIKKTVDWALENKFATAAFNILMPYPKTPLYQKLHMQKVGCYMMENGGCIMNIDLITHPLCRRA